MHNAKAEGEPKRSVTGRVAERKLTGNLSKISQNLPPKHWTRIFGTPQSGPNLDRVSRPAVPLSLRITALQ